MLRTHENSIVNLIFAAGLVIYGLLVWTGKATRQRNCDGTQLWAS